VIDGPRALAVALEAARDAGELLLATLGKLDLRALGRKSSLSDLVTRADVESERLVVGRLRKAFPAHAIEAEEEVRDARGSADGPRWFLDPLDGTVNFVHRIPFFAVSLALYDGGRPEVAVVHAPLLRETFSALRGGGAFLNGERLRVTDTGALSEALLATGFPYVRGDRERDNRANFDALLPEVRGMRRMGSAAIDLAYTAAGRFDGYWELGLAPHDVAAGALLVREAGGLVSDADGGEDWLRGGHVVAGGARLHALLRPRIRRAKTGH
jgi:myo-inositol-1(or 4)-monophosphatase